MKPENLKGIIPAFMTGFTDNGENIDTERIRSLAEYHISKGVNGLYVGGSSGEMLLSGLAAGADGGIGTTYNFMPDVFVNIFNSFRNNSIAEARLAQSNANRVIKTLLKYGAVQASKYMISLNGIDYGECRKPFIALSEDAKKDLKENAFIPLQEWRANL